jgi:hypothetical protein
MIYETKQTAIDSLLSELNIRLLQIKSEPNGIVRETMINNFLIDTEQFKILEKEQIGNAYRIGRIESTIPGEINTTGNEYYTEIYGGKSWN